MFSQLIKIRIVLIACLLPLLAASQVFPHHIREDKLLGKVKQITIVTNDVVKEMYMYDTNGNQTERWFFQPPEVLLDRYKAVYNEKGQLLEQTKFDKGIVPVLKYTYGYDVKGILIGRSMYSENNTLLEKYIHKYDAAGKMTDSIRIDQYGNVMEKKSWQYDAQGREKKISKYWQDSLVSTIEFVYNSVGKLIKETRQSATAGETSYSIEHFYDEKGNKIKTEKRFGDDRREIALYDSSGNIISYNFLTGKKENDVRVTRLYNKDKKIIDQTRYEAGVFYNRYTYRYDDKGNDLEINIYNSEQAVPVRLTWQYEYDKKGNWIKKAQLIDDISGDTVKREIEYY